MIRIRNARILDPVASRDEVGDVFIRDGVIVEPPEAIPDDIETIAADGLWLAPGFWDLHVHLREPGGEAAETVASGSASAVRGGFTTIVCMPNTLPALDVPEQIAFVLDQGRKANLARVFTTGCITRGRTGRELAPLGELADAGAVAFTDDGCTVPNDEVMRQAMITAQGLDIPIMDHAQDSEMEKRGVMHEGEFSRTHGLPGIPAEAEELQDEPALRSAGDRNQLTGALLDGQIEIFATDHAPHSKEEKSRGFLEAPFGVLGLETAIGITYSVLVKTGRMTPLDWVARWTTRPAGIMGMPTPTLVPGSPADLVLVDPSEEWVVNPDDFASRSRNTPFTGWRLTARAIRTIRDGMTVWQA